MPVVAAASQPVAPSAGSGLTAAYRRVRSFTERLCAPLETEDYVVQAMPDASPAKWHLAHTTWFFETFLLKPHAPGYQPLDTAYEYLFNSYYNTVGRQFPRPQRGLLSRPTVAEVYRYRAHVDAAMERWLTGAAPEALQGVEAVITLGLNHEQQHQELLLTDIKYALSVNPLRPVYRETEPAAGEAAPMAWHGFPEGLVPIGHDGTGFAFDNEGPRHRAFVESFRLASRPVTNGEYLEFMEAGGYRAPHGWLSAGWSAVQANGWDAPLYWERRGDDWWTFTLSGMRPVDPAAPVCHVSYFESDAYARWAGARLPSEVEWEAAASEMPVAGHFADDGRIHPAPAPPGPARGQFYGDVWEWTRSPYEAYPGYAPDPGALGEYNGKFMCGQYVLRGGSCATPEGHIRPTYRNFFPPDARWQFSGIRLARDGQ